MIYFDRDYQKVLFKKAKVEVIESMVDVEPYDLEDMLEGVEFDDPKAYKKLKAQAKKQGVFEARLFVDGEEIESSQWEIGPYSKKNCHFSVEELIDQAKTLAKGIKK